MFKKNKMKGFTLVELLAVIVILAIILVIAVPKIMNTIKDTTKASFESSAKMVAAQVENQYTVAKTLGKEFGDTGSCKQDWAGLNSTDYDSCTYEIIDGTAKVTLVGSGKFNGLSVCEGTRSSAEAKEGECENVEYTDVACFTYEEGDNGVTITGYDIDCGGTDVVIPNKINNKSVVKIGDEAFVGYTKEYYPDEESNTVFKYEVTTLEESSSFKYELESLKDNLLDENITPIAYEYTQNDLVLTSVLLPSAIEEIGNYAFAYSALTELDLSKLVNLKKIGDRSFWNNDIKELDMSKLTQLKEIGSSAFRVNENLTVLMLPNSLEKIGNRAFRDTSISEIEIPSSVIYIGEHAFFNFNGYDYVNVGNSNAEIGSCAFGYNEIAQHNLPDTYDFDCYGE